MIIYFSIGLIYLFLHFIFTGFKHSLKRYVILSFGFVLLWPIFLFNSIRLCFKIGKHLTIKGRWNLFFPTRKTSENGSVSNFDSSDVSGFFDETDNNTSVPF